MPPKTGPLTRADLQAIWTSALDKGYTEPFLKAGDGGGLEAHSQQWATFQRVSEAVDRTTQSFYLCPWSGQTDEPASGAVRATVTLAITRSLRLEAPLALAAGTFVIGERIPFPTQEGAVDVDTGRYYELAEDLIFHPGEPGPLTVLARALRPGYGYNNPLSGSIRSIQQVASLFENDLASISATYPAFVSPIGSNVQLATALQADTPVPDHVGQYFLIAGASLNLPARQARVRQFLSGPGGGIGSTVVLDSLASVILTGGVGTFQVGEVVSFGTTAKGVVLKHSTFGGNAILTFLFTHGGGATFVGLVGTGALSAATGTVAALLYKDEFTPEAPIGSVGGVSWRAMDWIVDFGLVATNALSPTGGRAAVLDEIGYERDIQRASGEADDDYRERLKKPSDVVSPNAIRRALNRTLGSLEWCFLEVGANDGLRGWFYDGDLSPVGALSTTTVADLNDAYDTDVILLVTAFLTTFDVTEKIVLETSPTGIRYATGYWGKNIAGPTLVFVKTSGYAPPSYVGLQIRGLTSGTTVAVVSGSVPATALARKWRTYFDYAEFRGFFVVCVPTVSIGEFGFHYDIPSLYNAYDTPLSTGNFFDGYPSQNAAFYQRIFQAVDTVREGGVLWQLERCDC
jgi:hypothetical protein